MAWYYDLVVLAILALCVWNGMRKGVSRSLLQTAATILSAVVTLWVSQPLAELCYTEFLEKPVVSAVEGQLNTVDVAGFVQTALSGEQRHSGFERTSTKYVSRPRGNGCSVWIRFRVGESADRCCGGFRRRIDEWRFAQLADERDCRRWCGYRKKLQNP